MKIRITKKQADYLLMAIEICSENTPDPFCWVNGRIPFRTEGPDKIFGGMRACKRD